MGKIKVTAVEIQKLETVYWCNDCQTTAVDEDICPNCKAKTESIGWFEHRQSTNNV